MTDEELRGQARERALREALNKADDALTGSGATFRATEFAVKAALAAPTDDTALQEYTVKVAGAERAYFVALCLGTDAVCASATYDEVKVALREFALRVLRQEGVSVERSSFDIVADALKGKS